MLVNSALSPVFFELGPITIQWYAVLIVTGIVVAFILANKEGERLGFDSELYSDFIIWILPAAILGARLYYVLFEWRRYTDGPWWRVFAVWEGGLAIHGALIASVVVGIVFAKYKKIPFWKLADVTAPSIIIGQAIGRWGNFMNQEAHGGPVSEFAYENFIRFLPNFIENQMVIDGVLYHPTFLYEFLWNLLVFGFLLWLRRQNPYRGEVFIHYAIWYSVGRFFIEGLRTDSLYMFGDMIRTAQFISILTVVAGVVLIIYRRKSGQVKFRYNGKKV